MALLAGGMALPVAAWGQERQPFWAEIPSCPSTTVPSAIQDDYWHGQFQRVNREVARADGAQLVFFGDSITWHWSLGPADGKSVWTERFGAYHPVNMGNSGDITPVMLYRVTHGNLAFPAGREPKVAVLLCGTNNFVVNQSAGGKVRWDLGPDAPPGEVAAGIRAVAQAFRRHLPRTRVILMGILPVKNEAKWARCREVNARLAALDTNPEELVFVDAAGDFLREDGSLDPELFTDGTHLTTDGYRTWARTIEPVLERMMAAGPLEPVEIMLIGDGLTEGATPETAYRSHLDGLLRRGGHLIDFVGRRRGHQEGTFEGRTFAYDPDHEGHWGKDAAWLAEQAAEMLEGRTPGVAVVQLGSAEIAAGDSGAAVAGQVLPHLRTLVSKLREANPQVALVLPTMIPVPGKGEAVEHFNEALRSFAKAHSTGRSPVVVADLAAGFEPARHLTPGDLRPNERGARHMAEAVAATLDPLLDQERR